MTKNSINDLFDPITEDTEDDENFDELSVEAKIELNLKDNFTALTNDVNHVDTRLADIQTRIVDLDSAIIGIKNIIKQEKDQKRKFELYKTMNYTTDLVIQLQDIYQKYLTIKLNYRKEQDHLSLNKIRLLEVDLKRVDNKIDGALTPSMLVSMVKSLSGVNQAENKLVESINELEEDPDYKL